MDPDLLSTISHEIDERLSELRPVLGEYEQLLVAADALLDPDRESPTLAVKELPTRGGRGRRRAVAGPRGSAAGAIERVAAGPTGTEIEGKVEQASATPPQATDIQPVKKSRGSAVKPKPKPKPKRAARGAAREAILGALEHGSHTVGELAVVTAMSGPNINGNLRRLVAEGTVVKAKREGKAAWALAGPAA